MSHPRREATLPRLVYVASVGRSGSTLLESILGAHPDAETLGELHLLPHELRQADRACACGEMVDRCPFWTRVVGRADVLQASEQGRGLDLFREHHDGGRTLRWRRLADFVRTAPRPVDASSVASYADHTAQVLLACTGTFDALEHVHPVALVDASKDAYRLRWLALSGRFDLRVVHVVKDAPAFVFTSTRGVMADPTSGRLGRWRVTVRRSAAWATQNLLLLAAARPALGVPTLRVRYEDLASRPEEVVRDVLAHAGLAHDEHHVTAAVAGFRQGSRHTVAGNPMRYEDRPIALDERWRGRQPAWARRTAVALTWPVRRWCGYPAWRA